MEKSTRESGEDYNTKGKKKAAKLAEWGKGGPECHQLDIMIPPIMIRAVV